MAILLLVLGMELLGRVGTERGITAPHHSAEFDIDESVLPRGAELLARIALER